MAAKINNNTNFLFVLAWLDAHSYVEKTKKLNIIKDMLGIEKKNKYAKLHGSIINMIVIY